MTHSAWQAFFFSISRVPRCAKSVSAGHPSQTWYMKCLVVCFQRHTASGSFCWTKCFAESQFATAWTFLHALAEIFMLVQRSFYPFIHVMVIGVYFSGVSKILSCVCSSQISITAVFSERNCLFVCWVCTDLCCWLSYKIWDHFQIILRVVFPSDIYQGCCQVHHLLCGSERCLTG